ncbi:hypothetical protein ABB37_01200 [Leptomonas pyrrhocoris]|uniref:Uncharacterized protein n=1 Tax=Leptomonas pyrrhocoris TaxID=157538 RepID=A0A0N1J5A0_LEPPY|nr:hypothetical protein ABB37_01200 [Leptomonas pyrrhocoris]XP_015663134.1 hypothetical protein ABB37_01200 [Leptomonas pyrrhocoris]KPA84694.1 hypothetical protein ABB37_01200 [Leptomonas pyrrhocoris]KPA84695.1 hypothetical protein ABB37_01200 [Leptomonas pyrrhocoris]|eukprot:XP_015663133.1 hypothetical protein ABB37_01200 [Leptomonas pyrrhocoris]
MQLAHPVQEESAELREALQNILLAADSTTAATSWQRAALEEKRRKVMRLLDDLSSVAATDTHTDTPSHLVSPKLDEENVRTTSTSANNADTHADEAPAAEEVPLHPPAERRLLGNIFSCLSPVPHTPITTLVEDNTKRTAPQYLANPSQPRQISVLRSDTFAAQPDHRQTSGPGTRRVEPPRFAHRLDDAEGRPEIVSGNCSTENFDHDSNPRSRQVTVWRTCSPSPHRDIRLYDYTCVTPSFWIHVWPCFGNAMRSIGRPTRVLVRGCYRFFEDVVERAAAQTQCQPACPSLYTPDGCPVWELEKLRAERHYLLFPSGGFYRKRAVPTALLWVLYTDARRIVECS